MHFRSKGIKTDCLGAKKSNFDYTAYRKRTKETDTFHDHFLSKTFSRNCATSFFTVHSLQQCNSGPSLDPDVIATGECCGSAQK
jgi:hypothetical protein